MNKKHTSISRSFSRKLMVPIAFLMLLQGALFLAAILGTGTFKELDYNALRIFEHTIENRTEQIEGNMAKKWSMADSFEAVIEVAQQEDTTQVSPAMANQLVMLLRNNAVNGTFVVYDSDTDTERHTGLYLKDLEPAIYSAHNNDIFAEFGSGQLVAEMGITMDYNWTADVIMKKESSLYEYYEQFREASNDNADLTSMDLARWSGRVKMNAASEEVIMYSMPLLDADNKMYGIVGICINMDYIISLLPFDELSQDGMGGYMLAVRRQDGSYLPVIRNSTYYTQLGLNENLYFKPYQKGESDFYLLEKPETVEPVIAGIKPLRLYNTNTPFADEQWAVIGMVDQKILLGAGMNLKVSLMWAFLAAIAFGTIASLIITTAFSRPIQELVRSLQNSAKGKSISLPRVYVTEIDRLAEAVEKYSADVVASASRLSQILHIMNQPIGAIEYDKESRIVYCTSLVNSLMCFSSINKRRISFTEEEFLEEIKYFKAYAKPYENDVIDKDFIANEDGTIEHVVKFEKDDENPCWLSFKIVEHEDKILVVVEDVTESISEKLKIEYERDYDLLTNLLNRRSFRKKVMRIMEEEYSKIGAMVMWDLDNLKTINDTYGHDFGDTYIVEAANVLNSISSPRTVVSRMSGDEFLVFFYNYENKNNILATIQMVHNQLKHSVLWLPGGGSVNLRASAGIVWFPQNSRDFDELIKYADFAMYSAKGNIKGEICQFDYEKFRRNELLLNNKEELTRFIDEKQTRFKFQPIVNAKDGSVFAYEALMRPNSDTLKNVVQIMRLAKAQTKLNQIEFLTFMGVMEAYRWQKTAFADAKLFINSIPNNRLSLEDFGTFKRRFGDDLYKLVIEIKASEKQNADCLFFKQNLLKQWGIQLAIDDFVPNITTGETLRLLNPQYIKLDMSIVRGIDSDPNKQNLAAEVLAYLKPRKILSIAEGVETQEEMEMLIRMGVDYLQGYYIGYPSYEVKPANKKVMNEIIKFNS